MMPDECSDLRLQVDAIISLSRVCRPAGFSLPHTDESRDILSAAVDLLSRVTSYPEVAQAKYIIHEAALDLVDILSDNSEYLEAKMVEFSRNFRAVKSEATTITQTLNDEEIIFSLEKLIEHFGIDNVLDKVHEGLTKLDATKLDADMARRYKDLKYLSVNSTQNK